jgi:putative colanic acid biosynthesis UDP-glucose lipid carrier transferase
MDDVRVNPLTTLFKRLLDPVLIIVNLYLLTLLFQQSFDAHYRVLAVMTFFISSSVFAALNRRRRSRSRSRARRLLWSVRDILFDWTSVVFLVIVIAYLMEMLQHVSLKVVVHWVVVTPFGLLFTQALLFRFNKNGEVRKAIVIGVNSTSVRLANRITESPSLLMEVVGFFDDRDASRQPPGPQISLLGRMSDVLNYVREHNVNTIYISMPISAQPRIVQLLDELKDTTVSVYFIPDIYVFDLIQARVDYVGGMAVMAICETPFTGVNEIVKRGSDIVLAAIIQILLLPIMLCIAICVKWTSPGPVFFKQRRYGLDGSEIVVYKFRTMTVLEDGNSVVQAQRDDPRLTKIGAFLRRTSLDELPQFINVLQGRMSIVGPRPHAIAHNEFYRTRIKGYMVRHKVRPGITGWAQVNGLRGETETLEKMKTRIEFDLEYLRHWSLAFDLMIIFWTIKIVFKKENAY